ncbi:DUF6234 family protein [Streptomyces sp. NBC_00378]|uniref:DUF6234 family protein n=1 Tax=unclassified Streptomyces TaxID=2593676 RepID=UPI00225AF580|nr:MULTISPECIES: DUF6234 family protein [unclassified Streptomyces]MCX5109968.1 DUF6234 family protein [Streptomyces sp. NBC_00378]
MTRPSPYRQPDPASGRRPYESRTVNGCLDVVLGLLLTLLEGLICAVATIQPAFSRADLDGSETTGPPPMDWTPVLVLGSIAAVIGLIAVVLIRSNWPRAGALQVLAALALCVVTVQAGHEDYRRSHPAPAPAPSYGPGRTDHQCLSGGDSRECRDSGS